MKKLGFLYGFLAIFSTEIFSQSCTCPNMGPELVTNGNFSSGNIGFTTNYTFASYAWPENYGITTNASLANLGSWGSCGDHTTGSGNFMWADASQASFGLPIWSQTFPVIANTNYVFSYWYQNVNPNSWDPPGTVQLSVNGVLQGSPLTAPVTACQWVQNCITWNSGTSTSATISIINQSAFFGGNDFGFDDISFKECMTTTPPCTINAVVNSPANICQGGSTALVASGGTSYFWMPSQGLSSDTIAAPLASPSTTTIYTVIVSNGVCTDSAFINVIVNPLPNVLATGATICVGGSTSISATGASSYVWNPGALTGNSININPSSTITYTVTGLSGAGCSKTTTAVVTVTPMPTVTVSSTTICAGQTSILTASGATNYIWSAGATPTGVNTANASPAINTTFTVTGSTNGCVDDAVVNVNVNPTPVALFTGPQAGCAPQVVSFADNSSGALNYTWNFGDGTSSTQTSPVHVYAQPGVYSVNLTVTNANGCSSTQMQNGIIQVYQNPTAQLVSVNPVVTEFEPTVYFSDLSVNGGNCTMYFGDGTSISSCGFNSLGHNYPAAGTYCASIATVTEHGCYDSSVVCVEIIPEFTFYIPNAFTPNGTQTNEIFYGYGTNIIEFEMMIFNRWGERIFVSNSLSQGWDGKYKDEVVQEDVYVYKVNLTDVFGKDHEYHGTVTLVR